MKLHFVGIYNGKENELPQRKHVTGSVPFKEAENLQKFSIIITIISALIFFFLLIIMYIRTNHIILESNAIILSLLCLIPHEFLHAIVFKNNVYLYVSLKLGLLFIIGTEDMSKSKYIFMCLLPNIIFGFIPFIIFIFNPHLSGLGTFGALSIAMGAGDYYNVYLAIKQMPNGSKTYLCGMHSYWYQT